MPPAGRRLDLLVTLPGYVYRRHASLLLPSPASTRPPVQQRVKMIGVLRDPDFQPVKRPMDYVAVPSGRSIASARRVRARRRASYPSTPAATPRSFPSYAPFGACRRPACSRRRRRAPHPAPTIPNVVVEVAANPLPCLMPRRTAPSSSLRSSHARRPDNQRDRRGHRHRAIPLRRERSPRLGVPGRLDSPPSDSPAEACPAPPPVDDASTVNCCR